MTLRKLWMTSLLLCLTVVSAEAKKEVKFATATPLTAEQSALVQKAVAREKVTIKADSEADPAGGDLYPEYATRCEALCGTGI